MPPTECIYQVSNWYLKACWRKVRKTRTDGRTERRTDGHCHGIIGLFFKRAYNKPWNAYMQLISRYNFFSYSTDQTYATRSSHWLHYFHEKCCKLFVVKCLFGSHFIGTSVKTGLDESTHTKVACIYLYIFFNKWGKLTHDIMPSCLCKENVPQKGLGHIIPLPFKK